ncbi:DUF5642 family protein [Mycobacterium sp. M1]|uniref:DUF5642 family protein n=1 Tax=Mycolicibacter acidiphilus TaxID=2835306 RepID=A0ABS5RPD5_9MYCO|nr:DUF5642 family protein [Mycolicibacter acidiphilus]MBS9535418.1 DUF5642 family protein [Mycolicibacter acidiphilus]
MASRVFTRGRSVSLALGAGVFLAACGHAATHDESGPSAAQSPSSSAASTAAAGPYDIARVTTVENDFPQGFTVNTHQPKTLDQQDVDKSGVSTLTHATFDPPQCLAAILPPYADPSAGTRAAGIDAEGDHGSIDVVAFQSPTPIPVGQPPAGCDRVAISGSPEVAGTAEAIPAPRIEGATTTAMKLTADHEDPEYIFTAALDEHTSVVVRGGADADADPQQLMSDLLVKATAAVRGR